MKRLIYYRLDVTKRNEFSWKRHSVHQSSLDDKRYHFLSLTGHLLYQFEFIYERFSSCYSFEVGESSGVIQVKSRLDREHWARISLILQAKDSGKPSLTANVPVVVIIDDVNDNPPVFSAEVFYGSVREDASPGSTVLQVSCCKVFC